MRASLVGQAITQTDLTYQTDQVIRGYIQCWKKASVPDVFENVASFTRLSSVLEELSIKDKNYLRKKISIDDISFMLRE